jgi:nitric oxide reductase NorQ protein
MKIIGQDENLELIRLSAKNELHALLIGPTGVAKTSAVAQVAEEFGQTVVRAPITGETTTNEFVGRYELESIDGASKTVWVNGPLLDAVENGHWFVADEVNMALPEILSLLHPLLDHDKVVIVSQRNGQVVRPHPDFRFFATMNPVDEYAGTKELNKAFMSRFPMILYFDYPSVDVEAKIISGHTGMDDNTASILAEMGFGLRKSKEEGKSNYVCSTRDLIYCAKLVMAGVDLAQAVNVSVINRSDSFEREQVVECVQQHINKIVEYIKVNNVESMLVKFESIEQEIESARLKLRDELDEERKTMMDEVNESKIEIRRSLENALTKEAFGENYLCVVKSSPTLDLALLNRTHSEAGVEYKIFSFLTEADKDKDRRVSHLGISKATDGESSVMKRFNSHAEGESCAYCG